MHYLIGIDIGMTGAIASMQPDGRPVLVADMPIEDDEHGRRVDARELAACLRTMVGPDDTAEIIFENIQPRPNATRGTRIQTEGSLMRQRGAIEAVVSCLGFPMAKAVEPQTWKRRYGLIGKDKEASRLTALRIFEGHHICGLLQRKKDHGRAESLLLARYLQGFHE